MINTERKPTAIEKFLLHLHPNKIDKQAILFNRTFGLGGINALLFILLAISGMLLRFSYIPTIEGAYNSISNLSNNVLFGSLLRNIHYWSASLMVVTTFLHFLRVFFSQSIYNERRKTWIYGLFLFIFVLFSNFTGYLLPWDQLSYWAVTIMTNMLEYIPLVGKTIANTFRGGTSVDGTTLLNFYNIHTGIFPLLFIVFMSLHFWLIRKAKGVAVPVQEKKEMVDVFPNLVFKELLVALVVIVVLLIVSILFDAPLLSKANPEISPNPTKAPWYFMGFQELLLHIHPIFAAFIIPLSVAVLLVYIPKLNAKDARTAVWFNSTIGKHTVVSSSIFSLAFTFITILLFDYVLHFSSWLSAWPLIISTGLLPFLVYMLPVLAFLFYQYKAKKAGKTELTMAFISIILTSYILMMFVGVWLRGEGMKLIFN